LIATRRSQLRRELAQAEQEEAATLKELAEARVAQWLAEDHENQIWLRYQALVNSAPDLQSRMIDLEGRELLEPSSE
jgi:hypothetical protein